MRPGHRPSVRQRCAVVLCALLVLSSLPPLPASPSRAQSALRVYGYVTQSGGGPIEGVVVDIWDDENGDLGHPTTDAAGLYQAVLPPREVYYLRFTQWATNGPLSYHKYFTGGGEARPGGASEVRYDAAMRPAANMILEYYDAAGEQVRFEAFAPYLEGYAFVTGADDLAVVWQYNAVQDETFRQHGGDWAWALPTLIVPPDRTVRLHLNWTVPSVGRVIIDMDAGEDGYVTPAAFSYRMLTLNRELATSAVNRLRAEVSTFSAEGVPISLDVTGALSKSQALLEAAEAHWSARPQERAAAIADWENALSTALLGQETAYLEKAEYDIPSHRVGGLTLSVRSEDGSPIAGAVITYEQRTRDFLFSGGMLSDASGFSPEIADRLVEMGVNAGAVGVSYGGIEPSPGVYDWSGLDSSSGLSPMEELGLSLNAALAYWAFPEYEWECPAYWHDLPFAQYKVLLFNHYRALGERYGSRLNPWMINEPTTANCLNLPWEQRLEVAQVMMDGLRAGHADAENLVTALAMPYGWSTEPLPEEGGELPSGIPLPAYLDLLLERGPPLDNIGLEMHFFGVTVPAGGGYVMPGMTLAGLARLLDRYDAYGVPLWIEPFQVPSTMVEGSAWWHRPWDKATQAEFAVAFYVLAFSRRNMHDICWSDATDRAPFVIGAGLLDQDLQPKPVYRALKNLLASWTTHGVGMTDQDGELEIRGFGGRYDLRVTTPRGAELRLSEQISEQRSVRRTVTLHTVFLPWVAAR